MGAQSGRGLTGRGRTGHVLFSLQLALEVENQFISALNVKRGSVRVFSTQAFTAHERAMSAHSGRGLNGHGLCLHALFSLQAENEFGSALETARVGLAASTAAAATEAAVATATVTATKKTPWRRRRNGRR